MRSTAEEDMESQALHAADLRKRVAKEKKSSRKLS